MILSGKQVRFRLSEAGKNAFGDLVGGVEAFEGYVVEQDHLGAWVFVPGQHVGEKEEADRVMLVKWDHFSTATLIYQPQPAVARLPAGFRP